MDIDIDSVKRQFNIIGDDDKLDLAISTAILVASTDLPILIYGENGVGKDIFSSVIHFYSKRKNNPFVSINCGAIPQGTIDSELFGDEKGSFTGAVDKRKGYFEEANNGTIFLDEIGEMPLETQTKLLRVLENSEILHVGSSKIQKINVRIIAATNVNLLQAVKNYKFREDLYYRLNCINIIIPPLRERNRDILLLAYKFANDFAITYNIAPIKFTSEAEDLLLKYQFPGNVRQLKNIIGQISILEKGKEIDDVILKRYLPNDEQYLITKYDNTDYENEIKMLYKIIIDLKNENDNIKKVLLNIMKRFGMDEEEIKNEVLSLKEQNKKLSKI
jgi:transcriptional regulator with PAS, ATPase and Fis domain